MLNSFWGKFGQKPNLSKKALVKTRQEFLKLLTNDTLVIENYVEIPGENIIVTYKLKEDFVESSGASNVVIAAFTTAQARLTLYDLISKLGDRVCYFDTDSVFFINRPDSDDFTPPLGNFLGDLTSELPPGRHIESFACGGPKNYTYKLNDFDSNGNLTKCVVKGVTMKFSNSKTVTFDKISDKITNYVENGDSTPEQFYKTSTFFHKTPDFKIFMKDFTKNYKIGYDKRVVQDDYNTVPYGYRG